MAEASLRNSPVLDDQRGRSGFSVAIPLESEAVRLLQPECVPLAGICIRWLAEHRVAEEGAVLAIDGAGVRLYFDGEGRVARKIEARIDIDGPGGESDRGIVVADNRPR